MVMYFMRSGLPGTSPGRNRAGSRLHTSNRRTIQSLIKCQDVIKVDPTKLELEEQRTLLREHLVGVAKFLESIDVLNRALERR